MQIPAHYSCLGVKVNLIRETSSLQWHGQSSQTLCIVDALWTPPGGETAAFQTDLECLCCCCITLYQSAVSASSHPAGSHQQQLIQSLFLCFTWGKHIRRSKGHAVSLDSSFCLFLLLRVDWQIHARDVWRRCLQSLYRCLTFVCCSCQRWKYQSKLANHRSPSELSHRTVKPDTSVGRSAEVLELLLTAALAGSLEQWRVSSFSVHRQNPSITSHRSLRARVSWVKIIFSLTSVMVTAVCPQGDQKHKAVSVLLW